MLLTDIKEIKKKFESIDRHAYAEKSKNIEWVKHNYEKLKKDYMYQFVAVKNQKIIDHDSDFRKLLTRVRKSYPENHEMAFESVDDYKYLLAVVA